MLWTKKKNPQHPLFMRDPFAQSVIPGWGAERINHWKHLLIESRLPTWQVYHIHWWESKIMYSFKDRREEERGKDWLTCFQTLLPFPLNRCC